MSEDLISALYPPPPLFYKYFTSENLQKLKECQSDDKPIEGELKFLVPPSQPPGTHYRGYGNIWSFEDKLPKLSEMGYTQLYEDTDDQSAGSNKITELHKLMKSLLVNFIELIGIMHINPSEFHTKIEDLKVILINMNHILNSYRPHQSRESLIMLLKQRINEKKEEINSIDTKMSDIKDKLLTLINFSDVKLIQPDVKSDTLNTDQIKEKILYKLLKDI
ncbi:Mediator of RNA polymerase II transcription subunit 7 [Yamadazyma tenuis]|uniref:Mediator of RNA polymerase II transcription subunit 7 n=1 Tax=Candida tenuis (strain ATCC 10573 / BCRC 21748 / CBS 615 / JCM 9827 / NBRC 10315 / NRRL Y-1498 / VKM Y-70) TaxID=590646 RepID=G3B267_CANTC|nr:uncharacterized protein CANTEDRAFT_120329 [Yamadazyma tenuis ATCC 10573]EGV64607.1 hypothetical protein CANTEDRAFT_120329 [Yamadazyma tenuis ATCC 10573]WEJ97382.1 Mediator of RNA polymerase II transcription subunit 7 [Yamadazyma tenuis]